MSISPLPRRPTLLLFPALILAGLLPRCANAAEIRRVAPGRPEYDTSGFHNLFMGSGYRDLWTTPIDFPVLDLRSFAGGLTPVRQVGSMQSIGLALEGRGRAELHLPHDATRTRRASCPPSGPTRVPARLFQDATTANHPGVGFVVPPLAEAAGVLHTTPALRVHARRPGARGVPRDLRRQAGHDRGVPAARARTARPGFAGATEIVSTGELWKRHLARDGARRRARAPARAALRPLDSGLGPAQQAVALAAARRRTPPSSRCPRTATRPSRASAACCSRRRAPRTRSSWTSTDDYENFEGCMTQGGEVDRWLLSEVGPRGLRGDGERARPRGSRTRSIDDAVAAAAAASGTRSTARASPRRSRSAAPSCCRRRSSSTSGSPRRWTSTPPTWPMRCA